MTEYYAVVSSIICSFEDVVNVDKIIQHTHFTQY